MSVTPTFGRYAEIPVDQMTAEQKDGYRFLVEGPRVSMLKASGRTYYVMGFSGGDFPTPLAGMAVPSNTPRSSDRTSSIPTPSSLAARATSPLVEASVRRNSCRRASDMLAPT